MLDERTAKKLIAGLKGSHGYPESKFVLMQMVKALMVECENEDHATRTLARCIQKTGFCPKVPEITAAAREIPRRSEAARRRERCSICDGDGFVPVHILRTYRGPDAPAGDRYGDEELEDWQWEKLKHVWQIGKQIAFEGWKKCVCR